MMMEERKNAGTPQTLILEEREKLSVSGVEDVSQFDEASIVLDTVLGMLTIHGNGLHINKLNLDTGELAISGQVDSLVYQNRGAGGRDGFLARLFR